MTMALRRFWRRMVLFSSVLASACSPAQIVNTLVPHDDFKLLADRPYGTLARQKLDIYTPITTDRRKPIVIFFYGGDWQTGSKSDYLFVGEALASRGFVVIVPDYRLYPQVRYPAFLEDGAKAIRWTVDHANEFGGDGGRLYVMGHSAGAYDAAMLALDRQWLAGVGLDSDRVVRGLIGLAGPYDFLPLHSDTLKDIFGPPERLPETQPIRYVHAGEPPALLITGEDDDTVEPANTQRLAAHMRADGGSVTDLYYSNMGHVKLVGTLASPLQFLAPTIGDVTAFIGRDRR
jgi:acetyl esterase/lipase